jgi:D-arabinonate dehydratase
VFHGGTYTISSRYTLVTEIELSNGVVGQVYGGDEERYQKEIVRLINGCFQELLLGKDPMDVERHWEAMFQCISPDLVNRGIHTLDLANKSIIMQAIAAVDIALWDAVGKMLKQSLSKLLGGYRSRLPVIAIGGYYGAETALTDLTDEIRNYQAAGIAGIKLKVGRLTPAEDAERVRFARDSAGASFIIACDANQAWSVSDACEFARCVGGYNVRWFEEPVHWYDQLKGLAEVRRHGIPVVAGQGEISRFGCRDLILAGAVDILNVDATIAGGVTEWRRISGMAAMMNVSMAHHEEPQVAVHMLAAVPHGLYVETFPNVERDPLWRELPAQHPLIEDGWMHVPEGPGLGIPLRQDVIERYRADGLPVKAS